jgi:hypothetical protein
MKTHLHSEQFDGHLHAACCRAPFDPKGPDPRIVGEDEFGALPASEQCSYCRREMYPHGGPTDGDAQSDYADFDRKRKIEAAELYGSRNLADGNEAAERGDHKTAERFYQRSQFWLDRYNKLVGNS